MSPSEQKLFLIMYKAQLERDAAQLQSIFNEHNIVVLPEAITGPVLYNLSEDYLKSIEATILLNRKYIQKINIKLKELS